MVIPMVIPLPMLMAPISVMPSMPMAVPQVVPRAQVAPRIVPVAPQVTPVIPKITPVVPKATPAPQPKPSFEGASPDSLIKPLPVDFKGVLSNAAGSPEPNFKGINGVAVLQQPIVNMFTGATANKQLSLGTAFTGVLSQARIEPQASFAQAIPGAIIPDLIKDAFNNAKISVQMVSNEEHMREEGLHQGSLEGVKSKTNLPEPINHTTFENIKVGSAFKISFPTGGSVMPVYKVGFPLGTEKPLVEPKIENPDNK
jgi:hypothetical protein